MEYLLVGVTTVCGEATYNYGLFPDQGAYEKGLKKFEKEMKLHNVEVHQPNMIKKIKLNMYFSLDDENNCIVRKNVNPPSLILYLPFSDQERIDNEDYVPILYLIENKFVCCEESEYIKVNRPPLIY